MRPHRIAIALTVLTFTVTVTVLVGNVPTASATPYCGITWGSQPKVVLQGTQAPVTNVRTGRHDCWDRLVIDLNGTPAPGYSVSYVDSFSSYPGPPYGTVLPVSGGAVVMIRTYSPTSGQWTLGQHIVTPSQLTAGGYRTFRDVVYGGGDQYNTDFGLGVRARLPFRVFPLTGPGATSRLVIDVAHQW